MPAAGPNPNTETEIKISVPNVASARRLLRAHRFRLLRRRAFETNLIFDTPSQDLRRSASLIRLRRWGRDAVLTYKGPPTPGPHKSREEIELTLSDSGAMAAILEKLGFHPVYRYEKYRSLYGMPAASGHIALDETPIGTFLELEGDAAWIDRTALQLGFPPERYITSSYATLYLEHCRRSAIEPAAMVFAPPKRPEALSKSKKVT